ncbi:HEXXH motif-containing putative peptide modification protein [Actinoplanes sp. NPDC026619]|uniref:aKG-HExxH-type peptide beta-hydroxylase n=1 Tax=Actinoplanes sp. NPDC026619 TaxID=3155798 RepID=UPI0033FFDD94
MKTFRLTDTAFGELAAGRPSPATVGVLRRAQASRHLLLLSEIRKLGGPIPDPLQLYDPMAALHTSVSLAALRAGAAPPSARVAAGHLLTATHDGRTLRVRLEDTDPLRSHLGLAPSRQLTPEEVAQWQRLLSSAWELLTIRHRSAAEVLAATLRVIVPVEPDPGSNGLSATSAEAFGAVAISTPADPRSFAVGLLHECQHSLLNAIGTLFDLVASGGARVCSPWRDDPRPLSGLLHGAYAYQSVTRFWRTEAAARIPLQRSGPGASGARPAGGGPAELRGRLAEFEFARWRPAVGSAAETLLASGRLTAPGTRLAQVMRDEMAGWAGDAVEPRVAWLAAAANAEHTARWRLSNLVVGADTVAELVAAWQQGRPPPAGVAAELRPSAGRRLASSERLTLVHRALREGGDDPYLHDEAGTPRAAYTNDDLDRWSGMAVRSSHEALRERPELVRAVWLALGKVGLDEVAAWLSGSLMSA